MEAQSQEQLVHRVVFEQPNPENPEKPIEKVVILRKLQIRDNRVAAANAAVKLSKNASNLETEIAVQEEMLKLLILEVNGRRLSAPEKESLDSFLEYGEYQHLLMVVQELTGNVKRPTVEMARA